MRKPGLPQGNSAVAQGKLVLQISLRDPDPDLHAQ